MSPTFPLWLANRPETTSHTLDVFDKFSNRKIAEVALADRATVSAAIEACAAAAEPMRKTAAYERRAALEHCVRRIGERAESLARLLCAEAGKPIKDARTEVGRLIETFRCAADESVRIVGEVLPLDTSARGRQYSGFWKRVPIGPVALIAPFNFPLNLAAHKIAPAIAAGCPFVLKPASLTPVATLVLGEILAECDLPRGAFSILPCARADADLLVTDQRFKLLSFTGSPEVGWDLKARAGQKKVVLELGGNAAVVIDDDRTDIDDAVARIMIGKFAQSGQSCIGVQRILIHQNLYADVRARLVAATEKLVVGDPSDEKTSVGPLITKGDAERLERWIEAALSAGARLLCGGRRDGAVLSPTLLENVPDDAAVWCKEAFGPVAVLRPFTDFDEALKCVNSGDFGLQAGIFTRDIRKIQRAWNELEVGGVMIGEVPSWRADHMPYGGVKMSGLGREGVRFAIEDMTEIRLLAIRNPDMR